MNIIRKRLEKTYLQEWENHGRNHSDNKDPQKGEGGFFTSSCVALRTFSGVAITRFALQTIPRRTISSARASLHELGRSLERLGDGRSPRKRKDVKTGGFIISNF